MPDQRLQNGAYPSVPTMMRHPTAGQLPLMDESLEPRGGESIAYTHDGDLVTAITLTVTRNGTQVESYAYDVNGRRFQTTSLLRGVSTCPSTYNTDDQRTKPRMRGESRR